MKTKAAVGVLVAAGAIAAATMMTRSECVRRPPNAHGSACRLRLGPQSVDQGDRVIRREFSIGAGCEAAACQ